MAGEDESGSEEVQALNTDEYVDFESLKARMSKFVRERDWEKYHNPKDLAVAISVEAGELLEIFQWMKDSEAAKIRDNDQLMEKIENELADILHFCLSMANALDIDLAEIILSKLRENEKRFPKDKYKGNWKKPDE